MIDPHAIIDPSAVIADDVVIGPWTRVGPDVEIGPGTVIAEHVIVRGPTKIGRNNRIFQFSSVGEDTADMKYQGERTRLEIGDNNIIREGVTLHRGTVQDKAVTRIGSNNLLMAYVHVGHDCVVGNNIILINNASLAGHVIVEDWAIISGYSLVHQRCRIGAHCYVGMGSHISKDVPAYMLALGQPAKIRTINLEGLKRREFSADAIRAIRQAFKLIYRQKLTPEEALPQIQQLAEEHSELDALVRSLKETERGITR
ncbi:MAG: acyl-ACP--UDP-N-acetylglucosamine O-acyltransferase [Pseudomonadales bacterium]